MQRAPASARRRTHLHPGLRLALWLVLALPAGFIIRDYLSGQTVGLYHPTGETSLRLMVLAMLAGPLADIFGRNRFFRLWLAIRRNLGVAAFCYAMLHLVYYFIDMRAIGPILEELELPGIWTGWLSFAGMLAAASISTDAAMLRLGRWWKRIQMGLYAAVLLAAAHWWLVDRTPVPALVHTGPLLLAWSARVIICHRRSTRHRELTT